MTTITPLFSDTALGKSTGGDSDAPITSSLQRFVMFPIHHVEVWQMYKRHMASYWTVDEIDLRIDIDQYDSRLTDDERYFIEHVLAFFAASDGIVNENLALRFMQDVVAPEARAFYGFQIAMENIHSETYSRLIDELLSKRSVEYRNRVFGAVTTMPAVRHKAEWAMRWIENHDLTSYGPRVIAFAVVEGVFFSGSFCALFWLKKRGLMPGLTFSNELISRDENLHCMFACLMLKLWMNEVFAGDGAAQARAHFYDTVMWPIVQEAVAIEKEFVSESLPVSLVGMNANLMCQYIEFVADQLMIQLGDRVRYGTANPFHWMVMMWTSGKTNFFERRVSEYNKGTTATTTTPTSSATSNTAPVEYAMSTTEMIMMRSSSNEMNF